MKGIAVSIAIIGIIVTFIVDIAVNRRLTWSLIVDMCIVYSYVCGFTAILTKRNKIVKTLAMLSILLFPLLYGIEYVVKVNYLKEQAHWFKEYAVPICIIWMIVLWLTVMIKYITKTNIWNMLGIYLVLGTFGSILTDSVAQKITFSVAFLTGYNWIDSMVYFVCAILCFIAGYLRRDKNKR